MTRSRLAVDAPAARRIDEDLRDDIGFLLSIGRSIAMRRVKSALEPLGLRARTYSLLAVAATGGGCTQREAATALYLEPSQLVPLLDELAGHGLLERRPHETDRRARVLVATERGEQVYAEARALVAAAMDEVLADLGSAERELLRDLLSTVIATDEKGC